MSACSACSTSWGFFCSYGPSLLAQLGSTSFGERPRTANDVGGGLLLCVSVVDTEAPPYPLVDCRRSPQEPRSVPAWSTFIRLWMRRRPLKPPFLGPNAACGASPACHRSLLIELEKCASRLLLRAHRRRADCSRARGAAHVQTFGLRSIKGRGPPTGDFSPFNRSRSSPP